MTTRDDRLLALLAYLRERRYQFVAVTPATHALVLARKTDGPPSLRDIFGWNRPFREKQADPELVRLTADAGILNETEDGLRSGLRVASLGPDPFLHSAYPTDEADAVFFGPDTYRFAQFIEKHLPALSPARAVDMGAGTGAGGICVARLAPSASITLVDTNQAALDLARVNARAAGVTLELLRGGALPEAADLIVANPPYMMDAGSRSYRDGGQLLGGEVALDWTRDALDKMAPGGTLLLYTGVAFVDGDAPFTAALERLCAEAGAALVIEPIDPDVFGEELANPAYAQVERIAAMGYVIRKRA